MTAYRSTIAQLTAFIESNVWLDMQAELAQWRKDVEAGYGECETLKALGEVNGRLEALAYINQLPYGLLNALVDAAKARELDEQDEEPDEPFEAEGD